MNESPHDPGTRTRMPALGESSYCDKHGTVYATGSSCPQC